MLSIVKQRENAHDSAIRRFVIDERGLHVTEGFIGGTGLLSGRGSIAPSLSVVRCRHADMKNILVVDDEFDILTTWRLVLQIEGYEVVTASNGLLALDAARAHLPDLIITDWMMPRMDGVALIRELAHDPALSGVPVVSDERRRAGAGNWNTAWPNFIASRFRSTTSRDRHSI